MYNVLAITNRKACQGDFLRQIERIAQSGVSGIILREKDLSPVDYQVLAKEVLLICQRHHVPCILHSFTQAALSLQVSAIHLPLHIAKEQSDILPLFSTIGISTHSVLEAQSAQQLGATYLTAGHIFKTDCKQDLPPRGLPFLQEICHTVSIPVYAIGGIHKQNTPCALAAGANGVCRMNWFMNASQQEMYHYIHSIIP